LEEKDGEIAKLSERVAGIPGEIDAAVQESNSKLFSDFEAEKEAMKTCSSEEKAELVKAILEEYRLSSARVADDIQAKCALLLAE